jgi:transcriptional regulator with XRE-family HTH domain
MTIGQRIKKIRNQLGFTQDKLASEANMSRSYLADVENDRYNPSFNTLEKIAEALNVSVDRLTGEAVSSIIEDRIKELNITLEEVANRARVPLRWLENLDSFIPGEADDLEHYNEPRALGWDDVIGGYKSYKWITRVAEVLGLPSSRLRSALARQEIPFDDTPSDPRSLEEIFADEDFGEYLPQNNDNPALKEDHDALAAHHDGEDWTEEELEDIRRFKEFLRSKKDGKA